jgi:hypothetical protein
MQNSRVRTAGKSGRGQRRNLALCLAAALMAAVGTVLAAAPTPAALVMFDQTKKPPTSPDSRDSVALRLQPMPDELARNKRDWLLQSMNPSAPDLGFVSSRNLRLDYLGSSEVGETCEHAFPISAKMDLQTNLAAAGQVKSALWLRVHSQKLQAFALSSMGSGVDAAISVYTACGDDFVAKSDDYFGLQALASLPSGDVDVWVKTQNLGAAGALHLRTIAAATVSGSVVRRDNGVGIAGVKVSFFDQNGLPRGDTITNTAGNYVFARTVFAPEQLYAITQAWYYDQNSPYVDRAYNDVVCEGGFPSYPYFGNCLMAGLTPITLSDNVTINNINFRLSQGSRLAIRVVSANTGIALLESTVKIYNGGGSLLYQLYTDSAGRVLSRSLSPATGYRVVVQKDGYDTQLFDGVACLNNICPLSSGASIDLGVGEVKQITVAMTGPGLDHATGVRINYSPALASNTVAGSFLQAALLNGVGAEVGSSSARYGDIIVLPTVTSGDYYLVGTGQYANKVLYPDIDCASDCRAELARGQRLRLPLAYGTIIDLALHTFPTVSGRVTRPSGEPAAFIPLSFKPSPNPNGFSGDALTDADGNFLSKPIPPADYFVRVGDDDNQDVAYPGVPCNVDQYSLCVGAQPLSVTTPRTGVDFVIERSAIASGDVGPTDRFGMDKFTVQAQLAPNSSESHGILRITRPYHYVLIDLPTGLYRIGATNSISFPQIYPTDPTPILRTGV